MAERIVVVCEQTPRSDGGGIRKGASIREHKYCSISFVPAVRHCATSTHHPPSASTSSSSFVDNTIILKVFRPQNCATRNKVLSTKDSRGREPGQQQQKERRHEHTSGQARTVQQQQQAAAAGRTRFTIGSDTTLNIFLVFLDAISCYTGRASPVSSRRTRHLPQSRIAHQMEGYRLLSLSVSSTPLSSTQQKRPTSTLS